MPQSKTISIVAHVIGWLMLFTLVIAFASSTPEGNNAWNHILAPEFLLFCITYIVVFYVNTELLIPELYLKKKYLYYFLSIALLFAAVFFLSPFDHLLSFHSSPPHPKPSPFQMGPPPHDRGHPKIDMVSIVVFLMTWSFSTALQIIKQWRNTERRALQAETDKVNAELSFLKAQINPHFLFNTLNNIYSMAVSKSEDTATAIMKLSNIMRYVTDEAGNDFVPLRDEVNCAADYIDLQKMRLNEKVRVEFSVNGELNTKQIAPLIFMTFIENVFKYGISSHEPTNIIIKIDVEESKIVFFTQNKIFDKAPKQERAGVGISNTQKRLQHIYPGNYLLNIDTKNDLYTVQLILPS